MRQFPGPETISPGDPGGDPRRDVGTRASLALAWIAALILISATVFVQSTGGRQSLAQGAPQGSTIPDDPPGGLVEIMSRYLVGAKHMFPSGAAPSTKELMGPLAQFERASPSDALRVAVAAAEIDGPPAAIDRLTTLADNPKASETLRREAAALAAVYAAEDKQAAIREMDPSIRGGLTDRHGWFGDLAQTAGMADGDAPRAAVLARAMRTVLTLVAAVVVVGVVGVVGLVLLILAALKRSKGGLRDRYHPPAPGGSVYLETFAIFLAGFLLLIPLGALIERIAAPGAGELLTWLLLLVPLWPLVRGTPWSKHRYALGWHGGSGVAREVGAGLVGYIAGLPIFGLGVLVTLMLAIADSLIRQALGMREGGPLSHPIVQEIAQGGVWAKVKLISLAVIWAPLVEESMFRGALYHHLRGRLRPLVSGLLVAFVFAVIHPQGIVAVPALMALAVVFAMMREWRGSLIAPITAHALHNGTLMTVMLIAMS